LAPPAQKKLAGQEFVQSVTKEEKSLWWEESVKQVGFEPGVKELGSSE